MYLISLNIDGNISATTYSDESLIPKNLKNSWIVDDKDLPKTPIHTWDIVNGVVMVNEDKLELYKRSQYSRLTRYQFMRGLLEMGYRASDIEAQIMLIEDEYTRELTMLGFKDAGYFYRSDQSVTVMRDVLGKTDLEIDEFWELCTTF